MTRLNISFCAIAKPVMLIYHQLLKTTPTWWKWILMRFCFLLLKIIQGLLMSLEPFWDTLYIFKQRATQRYFWCFLYISTLVPIQMFWLIVSNFRGKHSFYLSHFYSIKKKSMSVQPISASKFAVTKSL